jgi:hypothetical protein
VPLPGDRQRAVVGKGNRRAFRVKVALVPARKRKVLAASARRAHKRDDDDTGMPRLVSGAATAVTIVRGAALSGCCSSATGIVRLHACDSADIPLSARGTRGSRARAATAARRVKVDRRAAIMPKVLVRSGSVDCLFGVLRRTPPHRATTPRGAIRTRGEGRPLCTASAAFRSQAEGRRVSAKRARTRIDGTACTNDNGVVPRDNGQALHVNDAAATAARTRRESAIVHALAAAATAADEQHLDLARLRHSQRTVLRHGNDRLFLQIGRLGVRITDNVDGRSEA